MIVDSTKTIACKHCDLRVPRGLINPEAEFQFCCSGCKTAFELINAHDLESFYSMVDTPSEERTIRAESSFQQNYQEYDEPEFQRKFATRHSHESTQIELALEGLHCAACIWLIEKLPQILPGVVEARVNWSRRSVKVGWDNRLVRLSEIALTLQKLGYTPTPFQPSKRLERWKVENRRHLMRIGVAAACAGNNMLISASLYFGMFSHMTHSMSQLMRVSSAIVGMVALFWPGQVFLKSAMAAVRTRTAHMDLPISLALLVGTIAGFVNVVRGDGEIYFDSLSVLIFLLLVGRWLQFRQQAMAASAIELLQRLTPQKTRRLVDGQPVVTLVDLVRVGDLLQIQTGELFPVDGEVVEFSTIVDESILTGESVAVPKHLGEHVYAGTTNVGSVVTMRVTGVGNDTRVSNIVSLVEQASQQKPQIVMWADRIGGYFVLSVLSLAIFTVVWWSTDLVVAVDRSIALLIVACPCALALATPLTIAVALGKAAQRKIMIKGGDTLQRLQRPGMIWLDKTGTLTEGDLQVCCWYGDECWLPLIASLEERFKHPISHAILRYVEQVSQREDSEKVSARLSPASSVASKAHVRTSKQHPGLGVSGFVDNFEIAVGNKQLMDSLGVAIDAGSQHVADQILARGNTPCWVATDGRVVGLAEISDALRPDALRSITELRRQGWEVGILSGDHQAVVDRVAARLEIDPRLARGQITPEDKLDVIRYESLSPVVMIGDGVNDCAALAAADVGIAVKTGAEASLAAASVYLAQPGLTPILDLLAICRSTLWTMRLNLGVGLTYNATFATLAFLGYVNPLVAAILMPISSLTVVAISMTNGTFVDLHYKAKS